MSVATPGQLCFLHAQVAASLGVRRGVADPEALAAALQEANAATGGLFERAAALASALASRRPFHAASLALAAAAAGLFLRGYDLDLQLGAEEAPTLRGLMLADDRASLAEWLRAHTAPLPPDQGTGS